MLEVPADVPPVRRTGGRSARVRAAVLDATIEILLNGGIEDLTVARIAARSGVHETTIYRRWQCTGNLAVDAILSRVESQVPEPNTGKIRQDLVCLGLDIATFLAGPLGSAMIRLALRTDLPQIPAMRERFWENRRALVARIMRRGIARGELRPDTDVQVAFEMLVAPIHLRTLYTQLPVDEQYLGLVVDHLLAGLSLRP